MKKIPPWAIKQSPPTKAKQAIDVLLADKPDDFRATVFELARQLGWADDEPSFLIAIATHQLEALIKQYPERIAQVMTVAKKELEEDWQIRQAKLAIADIKSSQAEGRIINSLTQAQIHIHGEISTLRQVLADERSAMTKVMVDERAAMADERSAITQTMTDERTAMAQAMAAERFAMTQAMAAEYSAMAQAMADERAAMVQRAMEINEQQQEVLGKQTTRLIAQGLGSWVERSDGQGQQMIQNGRAQHYWQAVAWACGSALGIMCLTLLVQGQGQRFSEWGRFERWNQSQLQACRSVDSNTCNFHIKPPR